MTNHELHLKTVSARHAVSTIKNSWLPVIPVNRSAAGQFLGVLLCWYLSVSRGVAGHDMRFETLNGDVTTNEYQSFIKHLDVQLPPTPGDNINNLMVYERVGGAT